ncbi:MAG: segregation/condensation protein A [Betaproteobacteria bacterium]|nr:segregation/condensation protein A [Betaproteobacteria bacterium]
MSITTAEGVIPSAVARLYGEPLIDLPRDLYIPPDALEVILEAFEGPLDLLLYLIRRQNFNILDIPMVEVTRQYLTYIDEVRNHNLELAAEYLLMAAMLIEIKSRMLLPVRPRDGEPEPEDPRAELVRRLLEYEKIKLAAEKIDAIPQVGREIVAAQVVIDQSIARLPQVSAIDLQSAWRDLMRRARLVAHHHVSREALSVREHMSKILRQLQGVAFVEFADLFEEALALGGGLPAVVVHFLALLELAREGLVEITQAVPLAPIYVRLSQGMATAA